PLGVGKIATRAKAASRRLCFAVYLSHERDLCIFFLEIGLIDADGVDPERPRMLVMSHLPESVPAIHAHATAAAIDV
ncbi:UNVERIFIED_CONTAM: hypothetical protein NY603_38765, partial [Bacteroidetes bacterium 56_B9]